MLYDREAVVVLRQDDLAASQAEVEALGFTASLQGRPKPEGLVEWTLFPYQRISKISMDLLSNKISIVWGIKTKVNYTDKSGKKVEQAFSTEDEGKKLKEKLKAQGVTDAKWEW